MDRIEVELDPIQDYPQNLLMSSPLFEAWCIHKLKSAGIPIKGTLVFRGLESGLLTRHEDFNRPHIIHFTWQNNNEEEKLNATS